MITDCSMLHQALPNPAAAAFSACAPATNLHANGKAVQVDNLPLVWSWRTLYHPPLVSPSVPIDLGRTGGVVSGD